MPLIDFYKSVRQRTEDICRPLKIEDYVPQADVFVSPAKWHLAHTSWFFEEMILSKYHAGYNKFNKHFSFLFNSYYNTVGERTRREYRGLITRPTVNEVYSYRAYVDKEMLVFMSSGIEKEILQLIELGLNHEQQHQELLLTDIKYTLSLNPTYPVYTEDADMVDAENEDSGFLQIEQGIYSIGYSGNNFCFDNELRQHKVYLQQYEICKALITNSEFIEFIEAGGYEDFNLWLDEGWSWVKENKISSPLYWKNVHGDWHYYTLAGFKNVNPDAMLCHINFYESQAFATWKGMRLPTEFEWEVAAERLNWGKRWEWTNSAYLPYPGFKISDGAVGEYNGKFMVNQMVLRGASVATAPRHSRKTYRNFFHPHYQWQFAGIRLVK